MPVCMNNTHGLVQLTTRQDLQLLSPVALHGQDLHNTNTEKGVFRRIRNRGIGSGLQDVEHIELEANCLLHGITRDNTALS